MWGNIQSAVTFFNRTGRNFFELESFALPWSLFLYQIYCKDSHFS